jgi:hypothetical protein
MEEETQQSGHGMLNLSYFIPWEFLRKIFRVCNVEF